MLTGLGVLAVEIAVRFVVPENAVSRSGYHTAELREQVEQYQALEKVDLLIVGSSIAAVNYPPEAIDHHLQQLGVPDFVSFNAGIRGCNYTCITAGVRKYYLDDKTHQYALIVVSPTDLDHTNTVQINRSNSYINSFNKPGYQRLFESGMTRLSYLYSFDDEIRSWLARRQWPDPGATVLVRGHVSMGNESRRRYDHKYAFTTESSLSLALDTLLSELIRHDIKPMLLPDFGDSMSRSQISTETKSRVLSFIRELASDKRVPLLEWPEGYMPDSSYIDPVHLNYSSAMNNGRLLAQKLVDEGVLK